MPQVSRLQIHPIKAFDPVRVERATVLASGALECDRRWAFVDARGHFVNGKSRPAVHLIRPEFDLDRLEVTLDGRTYSLERQASDLERWMSARLGEPVVLQQNTEVGFPDDTESPGPTLVSEASLALVAGWFGLALEETRRRFRTNIEIGGTEPLWEDGLYGGHVRVGSVRLMAVNPCARCAVPSRNSRTGEVTPGFQKRFAELREASLPSSASAALFNHYYRFTVNTRLASPAAGAVVCEGDDVSRG